MLLFDGGVRFIRPQTDLDTVFLTYGAEWEKKTEQPIQMLLFLNSRRWCFCSAVFEPAGRYGTKERNAAQDVSGTVGFERKNGTEARFASTKIDERTPNHPEFVPLQ